MSELTYDTAKETISKFLAKDKRNQDMALGFVLGLMGRVAMQEIKPERKSA